MIIVITGVSSEKGNDGSLAFKKKFAEAYGVSVFDVIHINPEPYFDSSNFNWTTKLAIAAGTQALKAYSGADFSVLTEEYRDKAQDVWLYLNPLCHRTRNKLDHDVLETLKKYPDATVIGHSLGSVIAVRCLSLIEQSDIKLITMGSPLWMKLVRLFIDVKIDNYLDCDSWVNYYSTNDLIAKKKIPDDVGILPKHQKEVGTSHDFFEYLAQHTSDPIIIP